MTKQTYSIGKPQRIETILEEARLSVKNGEYSANYDNSKARYEVYNPVFSSTISAIKNYICGRK